MTLPLKCCPLLKKAVLAKQMSDFQHQHAAAALGVSGQEFHTEQQAQTAVVWWQPVLLCSACAPEGGGVHCASVLEAGNSSGLPGRGSGF